MASQTLTKQPAESRLYTLDFSAFPEIQSGGVISSIQSVEYTVLDGDDTEALVVSEGVTSEEGDKIQVRLSEGVDGAFYKITAIVATDNGDILEGDGHLMVYDY